MIRVVIIDYGLCNLDSIARAVAIGGADPVVTNVPEALADSDRIILPGVGAFPEAMGNLRQCGMIEAMNERVIGNGVPFLGICLGMHLIAEKSCEIGETDGLGWIKGTVKRLVPNREDERIPHVGWNEVHCVNNARMFSGIEQGTDFYFVHSYYFDCSAPENIAATTPYCGGIPSVLVCENIMGVQFHPEKSQKPGARLLANFLGV